MSLINNWEQVKVLRKQWDEKIAKASFDYSISRINETLTGSMLDIAQAMGVVRLPEDVNVTNKVLAEIKAAGYDYDVRKHSLELFPND